MSSDPVAWAVRMKNGNLIVTRARKEGPAKARASYLGGTLVPLYEAHANTGISRVWLVYTEKYGECEGMFDADTEVLLDAWSCNDATWRGEYFAGLLKALGVTEEEPPEDKRNALEVIVAKALGATEEDLADEQPF